MPAIRCHYDVLGVPKDADDALIKKSHRKMALKWHPDKNLDNPEEAADQFRLVQQAYECLSDSQERKWYDDHRDAILAGWSAGGAENNGDAGAFMLFQVVPFMHPGCYSGYGDEEGSFFQVYGAVINDIVKCEVKQDEVLIELPTDFGSSDSDWSLVQQFYQHWESFQSALNFAWEDKYNVMEDAPSRRVRRLMEDENKKARRAAKRTYNQDILALIAFMKRRDPRVKAKQREMEEKRLEQQRKQKQEAEERKQQQKEAKEAWKEEAARAMALAEEQDRAAGRVRLADLEDDYDYGGGKKKGKRGRGKKNKNKKKNQMQDDWDQQADQEVAVNGEGDEVDGNGQDEIIPQNDESETTEPVSTTPVEPAEPMPEQDDVDMNEFIDDDDSSYSSEEEEPDVWRCDVCKKDFKSQGQLENHLKSKKHKQAVKKYAAKMNMKEDEVMAEMMAALGR
mmetsp:Transcript_27909/g.67907  ORF Transcript_27909/g.67907 Transcript_27909/m.67907 type:complete len:452 (+) Transcript_27909:132-1487(+)|eukprot:CAMPEP_0113628220 /NCGR_PEP_ID=MMETSP0017_2-20120614/14621_1 /TAXON_ID=2856 /ORGANISM="Cylindrotheca closterium" /LENGTH=451 /DNA_ID=CAMNT_0000538515 /DNA_START=64 /DNA_END=1419 /DNA_ORIENTATION=+ /assembly_acc=CAM_ASM_000147